jgi:hypothetical protein
MSIKWKTGVKENEVNQNRKEGRIEMKRELRNRKKRVTRLRNRVARSKMKNHGKVRGIRTACRRPLKVVSDFSCL